MHTSLLIARIARVSALAAVLGAVPSAFALYKVIGPDGRVTYTDRPPPEATATGRVTPLGASGGPVAAPEGDPRLPFELRQLAQRFPVTLYASADCPPCDAGRTLLRERGVPYSEKRISSEDDAAALERLAGGRTVPALTIGAQVLRGYTPGEWTGFLDAAGYPKESRLPRGWQAAPAAPLVERVTPAAAAPRPAPVPSPNAAPARSAPPEAPPQAGGIRF